MAAWVLFTAAMAASQAPPTIRSGTTAPQSDTAISPAVRRACDVLKSVVSSTAGASVTSRDHWSADDARPSPARGCGLDVSGSFAAARASGDAVTRVRNTLVSMGWIELPDYAADGKDGPALAYRAGRVACFVRGAWDGGTDDEPAVEGEDWYKAWVFCAQHEGVHRSKPSGVARRDLQDPAKVAVSIRRAASERDQPGLRVVKAPIVSVDAPLRSFVADVGDLVTFAFEVMQVGDDVVGVPLGDLAEDERPVSNRHDAPLDERSTIEQPSSVLYAATFRRDAVAASGEPPEANLSFMSFFGQDSQDYQDCDVHHGAGLRPRVAGPSGAGIAPLNPRNPRNPV